MYSVLHRRYVQYLLELITFNDGDSGRRCLRSATSRTVVLPLFSVLGHNLAAELFQYVAPHSLEQFTQDTASY